MRANRVEFASKIALPQSIRHAVDAATHALTKLDGRALISDNER